jgi:FixJ family two-component response regulator
MSAKTQGSPAARIILVDDDEAVRNALRFSLELDGFAVQAYASADAVPDADDQAGCLVLDYNLPDQNGLQSLAALRSRRAGLPAVLIATNPPEQLRRRAIAAGVTLVEKPILGETLVEGVRSALGMAT